MIITIKKDGLNKMIRDDLLSEFKYTIKKLNNIKNGELILLIKDVEFFHQNLKLELKNRRVKNG